MKKLVLWICLLLMILTSCTTTEPETEVYTPTYEVACITEAIRNYANIRAPLPKGWEYKVIEETSEYGNEIFGIRFWPTEHPELSVRIGCRPGIAVPSNREAGTITMIPCADGSSLRRHTKRKGTDAQTITISWMNYPNLYIADYILPDALEAEYEPIIREILCFTQFGTLRSMQEAIDLVYAALGAEEEEIYSAYSDGADPVTGGWDITILETEDAKLRYFYVFADGEVKEYFMEDQPLGGTGIVFRESEDIQ